MNSRGIVVSIIAAFAVLFAIIAVPSLVENLDAKEIMVIQSLQSGNLDVYTDPGMKAQMFGKVTTYPRREQYSFSASKDQGKNGDQSIKTGFNDGGTGYVSGVMSWEMPLKPEQVVRLHKEFGSFIAIEQQLIRPMLEKVIFSAGATMSSIESSSERRPEIPQTIDDQLANGPYLTKVATVVTIDSITKQEKSVRIVTIATDKDGKPIRASASTIKEYGITLSPVTINDIRYEESVKIQIAERQKSTQAVQLSQAAAIKATQDTVTTEQQGKADAAKAKWAQEAIKATAVTQAQQALEVARLGAQQKLDVATLGAKEAEQYKHSQILRGEGDATRAKLVMQANGALEQKLAAAVEINKNYATAIGEYQGNWVPATVMGSGGGNVNGAAALVELLTAKTARELSLDMKVGK